jgi:antitoxin component HigA of HigAB toxin-antitoxin module
MPLKPIRNAKQHRAALREIERLWAAKSGTPDHDRLEVLATLVADYEDKHQPIYPPDPAAAIRFRMEQLSLDRKALQPSILSRAPRVRSALRPPATHSGDDPPPPSAARDPGGGAARLAIARASGLELG